MMNTIVDAIKYVVSLLEKNSISPGTWCDISPPLYLAEDHIKKLILAGGARKLPLLFYLKIILTIQFYVKI